MTAIDTNLVSVNIGDVRPTQMTAGYRQVQKKQLKWKKMSDSELTAAASKQCFPGVIGPKKKIYITDHHHTALAILKTGSVKVRVGIQDDLSMLSEDEFWIFMDHRTWVHCYDAVGRRKSFKQMPTHLSQLKDDPYRSLAAEVRMAGGFAKSELPYLEFLWANFFRQVISRTSVQRNPKRALKNAMKFAKSTKANYLPGWAGPN